MLITINYNRTLQPTNKLSYSDQEDEQPPTPQSTPPLELARADLHARPILPVPKTVAAAATVDAKQTKLWQPKQYAALNQHVIATPQQHGGRRRVNRLCRVSARAVATLAVTASYSLEPTPRTARAPTTASPIRLSAPDLRYGHFQLRIT